MPHHGIQGGGRVLSIRWSGDEESHGAGLLGCYTVCPVSGVDTIAAWLASVLSTASYPV